MNSINGLSIKRGDTFSFIVKRTDSDGNPLTGDEDKLRSYIRTVPNHKLIGTFTITETEEPGNYLFSIPASITRTWNEGSAAFDIEYRDGNTVYSSENINVTILKDVTYD